MLSIQQRSKVLLHMNYRARLQVVNPIVITHGPDEGENTWDIVDAVGTEFKINAHSSNFDGFEEFKEEEILNEIPF